MMAGLPAFGGENQGGSLFQAPALTAHGVRNDFASEMFCVHEVISALDASYGRLQGCSGQDLNHGHSHLIAFVADDYKERTFEQAEISRPLTTGADRSRASPIASDGFFVRRLTPR